MIITVIIASLKLCGLSAFARDKKLMKREIEMTYEEIWEKIKGMKQWERSMLAYEMTVKGFNVGYIHPHYYFDAKAIHDIVFNAPHKLWETEDKDGTYYKALKEIVENDKVIHIRVKRYMWLPRFINDWREGKIVRKYICSRTIVS